jgi:pyruvate dehydrogenase E1 component alpha subunit
MANLLAKNREAVPDEEALGRSPSLGVISDLIQSFHPNTSLTLFRRMCLIRHFELGIVRAAGDGLITYPVYLSLGQEAIGAALSLVIPEYMIFAQHRCHGIYLAFGGDPEKLRDELLGLPSGTSGGRAGSNCIQCHENGIVMFGHHGLIGENVPLGVGAALGSNKPTVCLFGDGAAEEDYVFAAMGFAVTHKLPVLFVCEDNNLSILTTVDRRRTWRMTKVAKALGMEACDMADDPWTIVHRSKELTKTPPAFLNIHTCRAHWHVGVGEDAPPEWDRLTLVKEELEKMGLTERISNIEEEVRELIEELWDPKQLRKRLGR